MNSHADIQKRLSAYCGGDLEPSERARIEAHLAACPACRADLADLRTTLRLIRGTPEEEPPPWLTSRIMANLREEKGAKRGWLQRIWFPLHTGFPVKILALLVVCVSGYYLSRTVETELQQTARQQLQEAPSQQPTAKEPAGVEGQKLPTSHNVRPVTQSVTTKAADQPISPPPPPVPAASPLYAPPPPAYKMERSAPATGTGAGIESKSAAPAMESADRALEVTPETKKKGAKGAVRNETESLTSAPARRAADTLSGRYVPRLTLRLTVADSANAAEAIRSAAILSGAIIVEERQPPSDRIRIRIPTTRSSELFERIARIGRINERPQPPESAQELEITIQW